MRKNRNRRIRSHISSCFCPKCGGVMYVPRKHGQAREKGHVKDLWCPYCKQVQKMIESRHNDFIFNMVGERIG